MRFAARDRPSDELTVREDGWPDGDQRYGPFEALAIVVVFVLAAVVVITFMQTRRR